MDDRFDALTEDLNDSLREESRSEITFTEIPDDLFHFSDDRYDEREENERESAEEQFNIRNANAQTLESELRSAKSLLENDLKDGKLDMPLSQLYNMIDRLQDLREINGLEQYVQILADDKFEADEREEDSAYAVQSGLLRIDEKIDDLQELSNKVSKFDVDLLRDQVEEYERTGILTEDLKNSIKLGKNILDSRDESLLEERTISSDSREIDTVASKLSKKS